MNDEVRALVEDGLYQDNLQKLSRICRTSYGEEPSLYGPLLLIFESLEREYDNQAIDVSRYNVVMNQIQQPILLLLQATDQPSQFIIRLNQVFRAFGVLNGCL